MTNTSKELEFELAKLFECYGEPPYNEAIPDSVKKHKEWETKINLIRNVVSKINQLIVEKK